MDWIFFVSGSMAFTVGVLNLFGKLISQKTKDKLKSNELRKWILYSGVAKLLLGTGWICIGIGRYFSTGLIDIITIFILILYLAIEIYLLIMINRVSSQNK
jgi:uncharacterized membrane protein YiaA